MRLSFEIVKILAFSLNILCLILGIAVFALNALGLERSLPSTDEHTFFIMGLILSSLLCMSTLIGCYGFICELLGVSVVYSFFIFILLLLQYLQMRAYPTHSFYLNGIERLEHAWRLVDIQPHAMDAVEGTYFCCGLYDSRDYSFRGMKIPKSCYMEYDMSNPKNLHARGCLETLHDFYQSTIHREKLSNWILFGIECFVFICTVVLCFLLSNPNRTLYTPFPRDPERRGSIVQPALNHINSRTNLLSNRT